MIDRSSLTPNVRSQAVIHVPSRRRNLEKKGFELFVASSSRNDTGFLRAPRMIFPSLKSFPFDWGWGWVVSDADVLGAVLMGSMT